MMRFSSLISPVIILIFFSQARAYDSEKMRQIFEQSPYVVKVETGAEHPSNRQSGYSVGTGILIKEWGEGYILTNEHVVRDAGKIWVSFYGYGFAEEVAVVGSSRGADIALLSAPNIPRGVPPARLGNSDALRHGEEVYALGHPYGTRSVTAGNITAIEFISWLYLVSQTPLNPGSSGGPLFNKNHEVIAINTAIVQGANLVNFSIPISHIKRLLPRLMRERVVKHASVGFLFHNMRSVPPHVFLQLGLTYPPAKNHVIVTETGPNSLAWQGGIRNGDFIVSFNGVNVNSAKRLEMEIFFEHEPGREVVFTIQRGSQLFDRKIKLIEYVVEKSQKGQESG